MESMTNADDNIQKYLQYSIDGTNKLQMDSIVINRNVQKAVKACTANIKIRVLYKEVTVVQEFPITSTFNDIKTFV